MTELLEIENRLQVIHLIDPHDMHRITSLVQSYNDCLQRILSVMVSEGPDRLLPALVFDFHRKTTFSSRQPGPARRPCDLAAFLSAGSPEGVRAAINLKV